MSAPTGKSYIGLSVSKESWSGLFDRMVARAVRWHRCRGDVGVRPTAPYRPLLVSFSSRAYMVSTISTPGM